MNVLVEVNRVDAVSNLGDPLVIFQRVSCVLLSVVMAVLGGCSDDFKAIEPVVQYPGPCQIGAKRLSYDEHQRLVRITEGGVVLEEYVYADDNTFTMASNRPFRLANPDPNETVFIEPMGAFVSDFTIDPETFEMRAHRIEGDFEALPGYADGVAEYTYEDADEVVPAKITVMYPPSWLSGIASWTGCVEYVEHRLDCPRGVAAVDMNAIPHDNGVFLKGESGATYVLLDVGPSRVSFLLGLGDPFVECSVGAFGIERCTSDRAVSGLTFTIERDEQGNITKDANGEAHTYGCWSEEDVCSKWRYVPLKSLLPSHVRRSLWFDSPMLVRVPCRWSPEVSIAFF